MEEMLRFWGGMEKFVKIFSGGFLLCVYKFLVASKNGKLIILLSKCTKNGSKNGDFSTHYEFQRNFSQIFGNFNDLQIRFYVV